MASSPRLIRSPYREVLCRTSGATTAELLTLLFSRYPNREWATFARFGWRESDDRLLITLASLDKPSGEDLDSNVGHVAFQEPYSLRIALAAEQHRLGVGVVHSHPRGSRPAPSSIDDDMDGYYAEYFASFAPGRPYVSLIVSDIDGEVVLSGRIFFKNEWVTVSRVTVDGSGPLLQAWPNGNRPPAVAWKRERVARLAAAFGDEAAERLRRASVAVVGAGGTGSAAIEALARAGVGRLILVDPETLSLSNLERVHGSTPTDAQLGVPKVKIAADHVRSINPDCQVEAYVGALPQSEIVSAVVSADVALGCTDQQHSRLALSDLAIRYLLPTLDSGVALEGLNGRLTGQILQLVRFAPDDPCVVCQKMMDPVRVSQELMPPDERRRRRESAQKAEDAGENGSAYWRDDPQLNTVGYLTTTAGAMTAGYAIGWLTRRFEPPFQRLQMNLSAKFLDVTNSIAEFDPECSCQRVRGWADQGALEAYVTPPNHWSPAVRLSE